MPTSILAEAGRETFIKISTVDIVPKESRTLQRRSKLKQLRKKG